VKLISIYLALLVGSLGLAAVVSKSVKAKPCWCWSGAQPMVAGVKLPVDKNEYVSYGSYGSEVDWLKPDHIIPLDYNQEQGRRIFYQQCVWCHADTTPAGPSNRSNVAPDPPLMNDGAVFNSKSDESIRKVISLGGSAVGKSAMMPPYGSTLTQEEINDLIAYMRVIASPEYHKATKKS
jgi:mono/diheme cytochrome c family protein